MIQTITIPEAAALLNFKDARSVKKFCKTNGIPIFSEDKSNRKYLIRSHFEYGSLKKFIQYLKIKYGGTWFDAFKAYMNMDILSIAQIEHGICVEKGKKKDGYVPKGHHEISFLKSLTAK